ncbi:conserved hypothetical protein [Verticillium alfalfae VaMs.102]|uniref:Uncharacterized protein n=1 Tax=Verticillium alfalfae (strain VaMs.102 / ATCC MYA-4576 / FGSC 10136) TaxID=526221 RepID=C9SVG0_VERA1|nr:conserved hypothetical protein [Verticillium alfalfae VaMs.102]EEY22775.1 conserved hypothetical protein [Verticillium alfalfae VaMs.102]
MVVPDEKVPSVDPPTSPETRTHAAPLTDAQKEHFRAHGWLRVTECFTQEQADWVNKDLWSRLGMDPNNKSSWQARTHMPAHRSFDAQVFAPKAWSAITELCAARSSRPREPPVARLAHRQSGQPRVRGQARPSPGPRQLARRRRLLRPLPRLARAGPPRDPPLLGHRPRRRRHQASAPTPYPRSPATCTTTPRASRRTWCPAATPTSPRRRASASSPTWRAAARTAASSRRTAPSATSSCIAHAALASRNPLRRLRVITNPPIFLRAPQRFDRDDCAYSLVEQVTLRALGAESLPGWRITAPREFRVPHRLKVQQKRKEEELKRLGGGVEQPGPAIGVPAA